MAKDDSHTIKVCGASVATPCGARQEQPKEQVAPQGYKRCPLCDKLVHSRGFGGHMHGIHGVRIGEKARLADLQQRLEKHDAMWERVRLMRPNLFHFQGYQVLVIPDESKEVQGDKG